MNTLTYFCKGFMAIAKGDSEEVKALKIERKAVSALTSQIAVKKGETPDLEDKVEEAKEHLEAAKFNFGEESFNNNSYVSNLIQAKNNLSEAEEALEAHLALISFLEENLAKFK